MAGRLRFGTSLPRPEDDGPATPTPPVRLDIDEAALAGIEGDLDTKALFHRMMRISLTFFASEVIKGDVRASSSDEQHSRSGATVIADHHQEWDDIIRTKDLACIIAPRDHGKSHIFTVAYPIWEGWRRPGIVITIFSETQPQAEEQVGKIKAEVENNPRLQHLMDPDCWSAKKIRFTNGSIIHARGFGTKARGLHPHVIVCDDVVSESAMYSQLIRDRNYNYFLAAVRNMLVPGGKLLVIGTPQHEDDLYGRLEKNAEWFFKRYAAIDQEGRILFPERYDMERLEARKREIGEIRFAREFMGRPVAGGASLIPDRFVTGIDFLIPTATIGPFLRDGKLARPWWVEHGVRSFFAGVDIATSANVSSDWFVIFVMGLDVFGNRWVVDIVREQGLDYKVQKAMIHERSKLWRCELVCIESNGAQAIYGQELILDTDVPVFLHQTGADKHSLEKGIPSLRLFFENRKYRCPRGDEDSIIATSQWIGEMQSWTFSDGKIISVARHDDVAMAHWHCELAIQQGTAFQFAFGEQPGDQEAAENEAQREQAMLGPDGDDPWITLGLEPQDMARKPGQRGNLDFGFGSSHQGTMSPDQQRPPPHPLGGVPSFGLPRALIKGVVN